MMAYSGTWGTFVHIPKCGGWGLRRFLHKQLGAGSESGPFHGLPTEHFENGWTVVRHPIDWLRSIWTYRQNDQWRINPRVVNYWPAILGLTQWAAGLSWPEFVDALCAWDYDIVNAVYGMYRHPQVRIYQLEHISDLLTDLDITAPLHVTHITPGKPEVTPEQRLKLEHVCRYSLRAYGYDSKPLTEINTGSMIAEIATLRQRCAELEVL